LVTGGAEVFDGAGNTLFTRNLEPGTAKALLEFAYNRGLYANVYIGGNIVFRERNSATDAYEERAGYTGILVPDLLEREILTPKVLVFASDDNMADIQESVRKEYPELIIVRSFATYLEFLSPGVSKGSALEFAANYYGIDRNEIIAIGDTEIDIPMIKFAGLGVAVASADSGAKQAADIVCASNEQGGVADVIDKYILEA
jgi:Cof subfamily protein (haloacid dehalogenase superfamily)